MKYYLLLASLILYSCVTEPSNESDCDVGYKKINEKCYNEIDLSILQQIIDSSSYTKESISGCGTLIEISLDGETSSMSEIIISNTLESNLPFEYFDSSDDESDIDACSMPNYSVYLTSNGSVLYNSSSNITNFHFKIDGASVINASGGNAENKNFMISMNDSTVWGISLDRSTINSSLDTNTNNIIEPLELPQRWDESGRLISLWLYDISLSGKLPINIGDLTYLDTLNLSYNNLSGDIPLGIGNLKNLRWLYVKLNNFSGTIPDTICKIYPNLNNVSFAYNKFCPPYPECIPKEKIGAQDTTNCITN